LSPDRDSDFNGAGALPATHASKQTFRAILAARKVTLTGRFRTRGGCDRHCFSDALGSGAVIGRPQLLNFDLVVRRKGREVHSVDRVGHIISRIRSGNRLTVSSLHGPYTVAVLLSQPLRDRSAMVDGERLIDRHGCSLSSLRWRQVMVRLVYDVVTSQDDENADQHHDRGDDRLIFGRTKHSRLKPSVAWLHGMAPKLFRRSHSKEGDLAL
jgi:hypothetical protein